MKSIADIRSAIGILARKVARNSISPEYLGDVLQDMVDHAEHADTADTADRATYADDSDKWDGSHKSEYLDQPVRTTDAVQFASVLANALQSSGFTEGELGSGFKMWMQDGVSKLEIDELLVRRIATFLKLEIRELAYVGGNIILSQAGSEIAEVRGFDASGNEVEVYIGSGDSGESGSATTVNPALATIRCYWTADDGKTSTTNTWLKGMQARCQTFNIKEAGSYENVGNRYYWRLVTEVGEETTTDADGGTRSMGFVEFAMSADKDSLVYHDQSTSNSQVNCIPKAGDKLVQYGYRLGTNPTQDFKTDAQGNIVSGEYTQQARRLTTLIGLFTNSELAPSLEMYQGLGAGRSYDDMGITPPSGASGSDINPASYWLTDKANRVVQISPYGCYFNAEYFWFEASGGYQFKGAQIMGDWPLVQTVDGVTSQVPGRMEQIWYYMDCTFQVVASTTTNNPIYFSDSGQAVVHSDWKHLSGTLPTLSMKMFDTVNLCDVSEVSVSMGVTRSLRCRLWLNLLTEMDVAPRSEAVAVTVDGQSYRGRRVRNMPDGWWLLDDTWEVTRDSGNASDDAAWHTAHNSGADRFAGEITLLFGVSDGSGVVNDLNRTGDGETVFTFSVVLTDGAERYEFENAVAF